MKKGPRILLASLALTGAAFAQSNTPQAAPAAPAPAAPATDPAKLALAREAIAAMHADKMFDNMATQMKQMALQMAGQNMPADATPAQREKAQQLQAQILDLSMSAGKAMIAQVDQLYAEVYSETELKAMKAFFVSPEGQSLMAKQPQIMQRMMPLVQQMQRDLMPKIQQLIAAAKADVEKPAEPTAGAAPAEATPAK